VTERFPPDPRSAGVVVVASRSDGEGGRIFEFEGDPPEDAGLPDPADLADEDDLVGRMKEAGYRLTMVGGGAASGEDRRFYFRGKPENRGDD